MLIIEGKVRNQQRDDHMNHVNGERIWLSLYWKLMVIIETPCKCQSLSSVWLFEEAPGLKPELLLIIRIFNENILGEFAIQAIQRP